MSIISTVYAFGARDFEAADALKAMAAAARRSGPMDIGHPLLAYDERPGNAAYMAKRVCAVATRPRPWSTAWPTSASPSSPPGSATSGRGRSS